MALIFIQKLPTSAHIFMRLYPALYPRLALLRFPAGWLRNGWMLRNLQMGALCPNVDVLMVMVIQSGDDVSDAALYVAAGNSSDRSSVIAL